MNEHLFFKIFTTIIILLLISCTRQDNYSTIIIPDEATSQEVLAAKEVRRYVYQRTGKMLSINQSDTLITNGTDLIVLVKKGCPIIKQLNNENLNEAESKLNKQEFLLQDLVDQLLQHMQLQDIWEKKDIKTLLKIQWI